DSVFIRKPRRIRGAVSITDRNLADLVSLQNSGCVESCTVGGKSRSHLPDVVGQVVDIVLIPQSLDYYEDLTDLVSYTAEEPKIYYVCGIGEVRSEADGGNQIKHDIIESYRRLLHARKLLRSTADFEDTGRVIFLTPEKIEIPLGYYSADIPPLKHLTDLEEQFRKRPEKDPADYDQRLVLFRRNIKEYLKTQPPQDRFALFLRNFETLYDNYVRDYQLWIGNTFGELEKSFEEKRLKFVSDLNGILAGVQASLLSVPIAAVLLGDKYDLANPLKDFLLAAGVLAVGIIAFRLLQNQEVTLDATRSAINATKADFEKKHINRRAEFKTRLQNLDTQEQQVRTLLSFIRNALVLIVIAAFGGALFAFYHSYNLNLSKPASKAPVFTTSTNVNKNVKP